jgi:hypothetical protein
MKLGSGNQSLPAQASSDMAEALQKGIESLAAKHGKDLRELQQDGGGGAGPSEPAAVQAWEDAKANYKSPSARMITQETFDEVVQENVDDFDMELKEAIADACLQFIKQGVNLSNIIKTEAHFGLKGKDVSGHPVTAGLAVVREAVVAGDAGPAAMQAVCAALAALSQAFATDEEAVPIANSNDAIGTVVTLLRTFPGSACMVPGLDAIRQLCTTPHAIDQFNQFGLGPDVVLECLRRALGSGSSGSSGAGGAAGDVPAAIDADAAATTSAAGAAAATDGTDAAAAVAASTVEAAQPVADTAVLVAGLALVKVTALRHNGCKDQFFGRGVAKLLREALARLPGDVAVVKEATLAFRSLVRGAHLPRVHF